MKKSCMKNVLKKLAVPLVACGFLLMGASAGAQTGGDISYIYSAADANTTKFSAGDTVDLRIRLRSLNGYFTRQYLGGLSSETVADILSPFLIRVETGNGYAYAKLVGCDNRPDRPSFSTELRFQYTVRSGDLAFPMRLSGSAGAVTVGEEFDVSNNGQWRIYNSVTGSNVVWRFGTFFDGPVDPTFALANVRLQTIDFEVPAWSVRATENKENCRVVSQGGVVSNGVSFYVWSADTNIVQIVGQKPNEASMPLSLPAGSSEVSFAIRGNNMGATLIYLSPAPGPTAGVTNYTTKVVTVTAPPPPHVDVVLTSSDAGNSKKYTTPESDSVVNTLKVKLSNTYSEDVWVRLDTVPAVQTNVELSPRYVKVAKDALESDEVAITPKDGGASIRILPVITNLTAAAAFATSNEATVVVNNIKPVIVTPQANSVKKVNTLKSVNFDWVVTDVAADTATGMLVEWDFQNSDGSVVTVSNATGTVSHMFPDANTYTVTVRAKDKDGTWSDPVYFTVEVSDAAPVPYVEVVMSAPGYSETNGIGSLSFALSRKFSDDVWVQLSVDPADQSNVVFGTLGPIPIYANETNSASLEFQIKDGTEFSRLTGLTFIPVVVSNDAAKTFFTSRTRRGVKINNQAPVVTRVMDLTVGSITNVLVPATVGTTFSFEVSDVNADLNPITTYWNFGDGTGDYTATAVSNRSGFARGTLQHVFTNSGTYIVSMRAADKDGGVSSPDVEFKVVVGDPPTVRVLPLAGAGAGAFFETPNTGEKDFITVELSSAFSEAVTVHLDVAPPNSPTAGTMILEQYDVVFKAGKIGESVSQKVYIKSVKDGTDASAEPGFRITPSISATPNAQAFYKQAEVGEVRILNVAPVIVTPVATDLTGTTVAYTIPQDTDWTFNWNITDVMKDWTNNGLKVTWFWGDDTRDIVYGKTGSILKKYASIGEMTIHVRAEDKDDGYHDVYFKIRVAPAKQVNVTPVGPVMAGTYGSAPGLGYGIISSDDARFRYIENNVFFFKYDPTAVSANLVAKPYKASKSGEDYIPYTVTNYITKVNGLPGTTAVGSTVNAVITTLDSFFYIWQGTDEGLPANAMISVAGPVVAVTLPESQTGTDGATAAVSISQVEAVFSREWREQDNVGDINNDGIPDLIANLYGLPALAGNDIKPIANNNDDLDFLPGAASDGGGIILGVSNSWASVGSPFTAFLEIRGYHVGLNREDYGSEEDYGPGERVAGELLGRKGAERPTDPTLEDTDGDGYPDGWEYFFWYNTLVGSPTTGRLTGRKYNPLDIASGEILNWADLYNKFDPLVPSTDKMEERDLDGDGITDFEELATGTNPIDWDTDHDGMCDGWEILRGLDPTNPDDGVNGALNNRDNDYMAIATVPREYVPIILATGATNTLLRKTIGTDTYAYSTWYNYGNSNAPIALGRPVDVLPPGAVVLTDSIVQTNVLVLHFQVYHELGFDPRTAWTDQINPGRFPASVNGDAPNTKPFTAVDEYLLMKFLSENRVNGAGARIGDGNATDKSRDWSAFSTHPLTPDSDASTAGNDGMPDGWELYVACRPGTRDMLINPWNWLDGRDDSDGEAPSLINSREFAGTDSSAAYTNAALYITGPAGMRITRPAEDMGWLNKFWPTDPWNVDTDGDGLNDGQEAASEVPQSYFANGGWWTRGPTTLQYARNNANIAGINRSIDNGKPCIRGGGLNPCTMDTDWDGLTDTWEFDYVGTNAVSSITGAHYIEDGMDGTHGPAVGLSYEAGDAFSIQDVFVTGSGAVARDMDFDRDGLQNYQEYWVQAMRHYRYDYVTTDTNGVPTLDYTGPDVFFDRITNVWDFAKNAYWWNGAANQKMLLRVNDIAYVSTDPREPDTDFDGMDDYYEIFHGLNPILGDLSNTYTFGDLVSYANLGAIDAFHNAWGPQPLPMDFVKYPWLTGLDEADPDADGLLNLEEQLQPDSPAPACYNTDPTPLWLTDVTTNLSVTARFYSPTGTNDVYTGNDPYPIETTFFWGQVLEKEYKVFSFEMNEGYDTDNDGVSDKAELIQTATSQSDPQDHDDPIRRQALWFSGQDSAAQTKAGSTIYAWAFRSFTVELWACPENLNRDQVLLERLVEYAESDLSTTGRVLRANFRVGIDANGQAYGLFENAGTKDEQTGHNIVTAPPGRMKLNTWTHIALRMNGSALELWLDGKLEAISDTTLIPANGLVNVNGDPDFWWGPSLDQNTAEIVGYPKPYGYTINPGVIVLGARNLAPFPADGPQWNNYTNFYQGYLDEVRIWDGARSNEQLTESYKNRFTRVDLLANRQAVRESEQAGGTRVAGRSPQLPAELFYHYTFDNLFGADQPGSVAQVPRGFNYYSTAINRPAGALVGWWANLATKSLVYTDYQVVPWIENGVEHLPLAGFIMEGTNWVFKSPLKVRNSFYWAHYLAGELPTKPSINMLTQYTFPNSNDPYGYWYEALARGAFGSVSRGVGEKVGGDLVPLGNAFAKQATAMWDSPLGESYASDVWADTGDDQDADGLPDWWELLRGLDINSGSGQSGWYGLADSSGMTFGERYLRDIAAGWRKGDTVASGPTGPRQTADSDQDELPDWWENLYNLKIETVLGSEAAVNSVNGAMGDLDLDGLSNLSEYLISEIYTNFTPRVYLNPRKFKTLSSDPVSDYYRKQGLVYVGEMFTDHDFMERDWESLFPPDMVNPFVYDAHLDNDQDGWSNWSESRYGVSDMRSDPSLGEHLNPEGAKIKDYPVPVLEAHLSYNGLRPIGDLLLFAYSDLAMNGLPDAIFSLPLPDSDQAAEMSKQLGFWGAKKVRGVLSPGSIVPATVKITFTDVTPLPTTDAGGAYWDAALRAVEVAFDVGDSDPDRAGRFAVINAREASGLIVEIGTLDYLTGEYELDLSLLDGWTLQNIVYDRYGAMLRPALDVEGSYITINYQARQINSWPKTLYFSDADEPTATDLSLGHVKEGLNTFLAIIDVNGNKAWDAGEPCGVSEGFGVDIGYDHNVIKIELTDYTPGYLRMLLTSGQRSEDVFFGTGGTGDDGGAAAPTTGGGLERRVRVVRTAVDGDANQQAVVLDKVIRSTRTFIHEGDLLGQGDLALDWGLAGVPGTMDRTYVAYQVFVGDAIMLTNNAVASFTNTFATTRAKVVTTSPIHGGYVYAARPTFKWMLPGGFTNNAYPAFALEIKVGSSSGQTVYYSGPMQAPVRDINGVYIWEAPIYANSRLPDGMTFDSNKVYAWRVIAMNAKFSDTASGWSDWKLFRLDVNQEMGNSGGYGSIKARVKYFGPATSLLGNRVKVQAFHNAAFSGVPEAEYTLNGTDLAALTSLTAPVVNAVLNGLGESRVEGDWYVRAIIDHNLSGTRDVWESWGYANYYGVTSKPFDPRPVRVAYAAQPEIVDIVIEDADTDQDWFPDAWEFEQNPNDDFLALTGPATGTGHDTEINPELSAIGRNLTALFSTLASGTTDQDKDGLDDLSELLLGSNAQSASTSGDGYLDGDKVALGLLPKDTLSLSVTGLDMSAVLQPVVTWSLDVTTDSTDNTVDYEVLYSPSLSNPQWRTVQTGTVTLEGSKTLTSRIGTALAQEIEPAQGFFRVRLVNP